MNVRKSFLSLILMGMFFSMVYFVYAAYVIQSEEVLTCTDSDGTQNFAASGNVMGLNITNGSYFYTDRCVSSTVASDWSCVLRGSGKLYAVEYGQNCGSGNICVSGQCVTPKRVFVTNATYSGNLGGLAGGDSICNQTAANANLGGEWVAWLSINIQSNVTNSTVVHAKDRIPDSAYVRLDGVTVADNKADLTDGTIQSPINISELGTVVSGINWYTPGVFTGTNQSGMATGSDCSAWTNMTTFGTYGSHDITNSLWTNIGPSSCTQRRLYCFEK